jgi:SAM-dependent methyltransferase
MLEWTGERFVPWAKEAAVAYEHLHRYAWVSGMVRNKRVLDLASGEGYGSDMLARHASSVVGVEIDSKAVVHAVRRYRAPNVNFVQASITQVPLEKETFDVIVCFEAIEHIREHDELLAEVKRLLKPDGLFAVSTPNKAAYRSETDGGNPFHVKELSFEEFDGLLKSRFKHRRYFNQRVLSASSIWRMGSENGALVREFPFARQGEEFQPIASDRRIGQYAIALVSDSDKNLSTETGLGSVLIDHSNEFFESAIGRRDDHIRGLDEGIEWLKKNARELEETIAAQSQRLDQAESERASLKQQLEEIQLSRGWRFILRIRRLRDALLGK